MRWKAPDVKVGIGIRTGVMRMFTETVGAKNQDMTAKVFAIIVEKDRGIISEPTNASLRISLIVSPHRE
jgi:hypothetical protein